MSESISTKVSSALKRQFELQCESNGSTKSEILKRLVSDFVDGTNQSQQFEFSELNQKVVELENSLSRIVDLMSHLSDEYVDSRLEIRNLVASLFRLLARNPGLLTNPDQYTADEFLAVLTHLGLGGENA